MSREFSRSRTHSPVDRDAQKILNLDSSPGSSRKHGEEGQDEGVHIPNFSKEISLDSDEDAIKQAVDNYISNPPTPQPTLHLTTPLEVHRNVSPKSILKRRGPDQYAAVTETREKTKCCHPLVNKIKHLADKTLQKLEKSENEKSPSPKRKKNEESQEIRKLKSSPGAVRRQKFSAIKLGDSDEMSKTLSVDSTPPPRKKKDHIYEDIDESKSEQKEKTLQFSPDSEETYSDQNKNYISKENDSISEKKSNASQDPSLITEENDELKSEEHVMEKLHKKINDINKEAVLLEDDAEEPNIDEVFQNQLEESMQFGPDENALFQNKHPVVTIQKEGSPNITITEIIDDDLEEAEHVTSVPNIDQSPSPQLPDIDDRQYNADKSRSWSKISSDHEYEIIEKPQTKIDYSTINIDKPTMVKTDDELSSTTSLERKYLQHTSDDDEPLEDKENNITTNQTDEVLLNAETLQKNIEDRYFVNTPSTVSRTECEISTSQVDSSALENLPLKRDSRSKNNESLDIKIQQRIKEGTGKLKSQAERLKAKIQNIKANMPEKPKITLPDRPKFKMPERPKISFPDRPKFTLPDRRRISLPDRPKFKKINISGNLTSGDKKKFTLPEMPKINVPEFPKFKMPERPKINFSSLGRKKEYKIEPDPNTTAAEFETKTYPRLFNRKKKQIQRTSSSPTLDREETPPPVFTFTRVKKSIDQPAVIRPDSPEQPREYGSIAENTNFENDMIQNKHFDETYDFDKVVEDYIEEVEEPNRTYNSEVCFEPEKSPSKQEYTHVINEIDTDEFFVRPRGISRENIQVREYLSDEIRQAFKIPKNALALMDDNTQESKDHVYSNDEEADPELLLDETEPVRYSNEDLNERDDGYYTFPPVRPSRAKRKKKELESVQYIDENINDSLQFSEVDLGLLNEHVDDTHINMNIGPEFEDVNHTFSEINEANDLDMDHEYVNKEMLSYPEDDMPMPIQSQTLPMPPKRKKKTTPKNDVIHSSFSDFRDMTDITWKSKDENEDIIIYRTEHEYIVPQTQTDITKTEHSPIAPRRNRSRSSRGTSICDDDRTSHGAESLTLDTHVPMTDDIEIEGPIRHESPGYATVEKGPYSTNKVARRSKSKTPPTRRRKSNSSERKYYTVGPTHESLPDRPPRKKSSTSLLTLDSMTKRSMSGDITQYVEIEEPPFGDIHKDLVSGEIVSKMKDRPLPPPPRPPRGSKKRTKSKKGDWLPETKLHEFTTDKYTTKPEEIVEIEVSTQTDPLPDDVDYELGLDENIDMSMSSSLKDIIDDDHINKSLCKLTESPRISRPTSRSEKSFKISDPKISELSKSSLGRTSPTVILVEKRVSSPTRINEREEMLTEASLTVQHIDVDDSQIPEVPPLPVSRGIPAKKTTKTYLPSSEERALERVNDASRDIQLDNLITQRLQVRDLDVGRLNVSELQASKILVSDIEGMTLQVTELDSKSGHISVSGIEFSQSVIDEIVKKFAELSTPSTQPSASINQSSETKTENVRPVSREEETQTDQDHVEQKETTALSSEEIMAPQPPPRSYNADDLASPPQRPPPPDLTPLLYSYLQEMSTPPASMYHIRPPRDRPFTEFHESLHQSPPTTTRRLKKKPAAPHSETSSDDSKPRPSPRRMPAPVKGHEPTITEAGAQFFRVCQSSISRTIRNIFNSFMSYISGTEDKKDVQMAMVIFLVLIAGLIMFGLSDSRTIHHHHWEFFNPPNGKQ